MVTQYPHSITISVASEEPTQNPTTGFFSSPTGTPTSYVYDCRAERNEKAKKIKGIDGAMIEYDWDVFMPRIDVVIPRDSDYVLTRAERTFTGKVRDAINGQLNSRLWL